MDTRAATARKVYLCAAGQKPLNHLAVAGHRALAVDCVLRHRFLMTIHSDGNQPLPVLLVGFGVRDVDSAISKVWRSRGATEFEKTSAFLEEEVVSSSPRSVCPRRCAERTNTGGEGGLFRRIITCVVSSTTLFIANQPCLEALNAEAIRARCAVPQRFCCYGGKLGAVAHEHDTQACTRRGRWCKSWSPSRPRRPTACSVDLFSVLFLTPATNRTTTSSHQS